MHLMLLSELYHVVAGPEESQPIACDNMSNNGHGDKSCLIEICPTEAEKNVQRRNRMTEFAKTQLSARWLTQYINHPV